MLRRGRHVVTVQNYTTARSERGHRLPEPAGAPVTVACNVQPSHSDEDTDAGLQAILTLRITASTWPGDINSRITYDGHEYDTVGEPMVHAMSRRTAYIEVIARRR